jgi:phosphoribosyl 1,2-cyclic phosphate phosphodiesterase
LHLIENQPFKSCGVDVIPIQVMHLNLPVFGFRIGDFTYITDANYISSQEKVKIVNSKVLVINALRKKNHISHFTLSQALDIIMELQPEKAYLTHMSHQMGLHEDVQKELPEHVFLAYDGLKLEI